ncbi:MAG: hypothetical protein ACM3ZQ_05590 [Bacillota bacterium]
MHSSIKRIIAVVALLSVGFVIGHTVQASAPQPGSAQDPLVSQSYVDKVNTEIRGYVDAKTQVPSVPVAAPELKVVTLAAGQQLTLSAGSELILRGGKATAVASSAGGLSDLTGGLDLGQGAPIPPNHFLLVAKSDGRGIKATESAIVLVRGAFDIR